MNSMNFTVDVKIPDLSGVQRSWRTKSANGLNAMANDFMVNSLTVTPKKDGGLRKNRRKQNVSDTETRVVFKQPYSGPQEAGKAGKKVFSHYTTPGTGAHFAENTLKPIKANAKRYFK